MERYKKEDIVQAQIDNCMESMEEIKKRMRKRLEKLLKGDSLFIEENDATFTE